MEDGVANVLVKHIEKTPGFAAGGHALCAHPIRVMDIVRERKRGRTSIDIALSPARTGVCYQMRAVLEELNALLGLLEKGKLG